MFSLKFLFIRYILLLVIVCYTVVCNYDSLCCVILSLFCIFCISIITYHIFCSYM